MAGMGPFGTDLSGNCTRRVGRGEVTTLGRNWDSEVKTQRCRCVGDVLPAYAV